MTRRRGFSAEYRAHAREWFDEVLQAARDVHVIGERRAAEGILLSLDRWFIERAPASRGPLVELSMVVRAILGDGVLRDVAGGAYTREGSVLGGELGSHITLSFDDAERLGYAVLDALR